MDGWVVVWVREGQGRVKGYIHVWVWVWGVWGGGRIDLILSLPVSASASRVKSVSQSASTDEQDRRRRSERRERKERDRGDNLRRLRKSTYLPACLPRRKNQGREGGRGSAPLYRDMLSSDSRNVR